MPESSARGGNPDEESRFPRALAVRLFIYLVAGHFVAFFFWLLFELGASRQ
ncbi:DUF6126 family protein [Streptomyces sp. ODS28]|uniref:DUF6126 family protein n=1 Tax=Streptomyces sp. ODS28 TaxID=3136688 RepID=UPI0031EF92E7